LGLNESGYDFFDEELFAFDDDVNTTAAFASVPLSQAFKTANASATHNTSRCEKKHFEPTRFIFILSSCKKIVFL